MAKKLAKERGAFVLVYILVGLLVLWWGISSLAFVGSSPPEWLFSRGVILPTTVLYTPNNSPVVDSAYVPSTPVFIHHVVLDGTHTYRGSLEISVDCNTLSTGVLTSGVDIAHVKVALMVLRSDDSCVSNDFLETPFSVSFSSKAHTLVVFDGLTINNAKISYSLVEDK